MLTQDVPEADAHGKDTAMYIDFLPAANREGRRDSGAWRDAVGQSVSVVTVPISAIAAHHG
ncbi:MAG UNVERIFIED_CONTAM: DUF4926 domain-containing protein [Anaerolineae bacterium]